MILKEGGNIFKTDSGPLTQRIATKDVDTTVQFLEIITGYDWMSEKGDDSLPVNYLGTTGRKNDPDGTFEKNSSGDLDLNTDLNKVNKEDIIKRLYDWLIKHGVSQEDIMNKGRTKTDGWIKDAGDQVHFRTPINGNSENGYVQTDFMFTDNPEFQIGSKRGGTQEFSGKDRAVLLSSIARAKGFKYSPKFGLQNAESGELVANDWNQIAQLLLGPNAKEVDTRTVESIIAAIKGQPDFEELVAKAKEAFEKEGKALPESVQTLGDKNYYRIVELINRLADSR
jgi:hypothetical protein|tara:strand:- start:288 stop:1136 length:849 start_codon:yes stop_codon:yes gene_type:complete